MFAEAPETQPDTTTRRMRVVDPSARPTHERLILAAEKLFAESGIASVSLRDIAAAAGQKNNVAVQYHFGDRENLLTQIVAYRVGSHISLVRKSAARLRNEDVPITPDDIVRDYFDFLLDNMVDGNHFLPFLSRLWNERGGQVNMRSVVPPDTIAFLQSAVRRALPDFDVALIERRWMILATNAVHSLAGYQIMAEQGSDLPLDEMIEDLIRFLVGGLQAPPAVRGEGEARSYVGLSRPDRRRA